MFLRDIAKGLRCFRWKDRAGALDSRYDLAINLEDTLEVADFLKGVQREDLFGAYLDSHDRLTYTESAKEWFDLSIISAHGKQEADKLKFQNRRTYQELIFDGLGYKFEGEEYLLPDPIYTDLAGDIAIASEAGPVWPMKKWAYYDQLKGKLEDKGLIVNMLPKRSSLLEHLSDVANHRCLVGGDSLPTAACADRCKIAETVRSQTAPRLFGPWRKEKPRRGGAGQRRRGDLTQAGTVAASPHALQRQ